MAKILIVDDRERNRYIRARVLMQAGYEILEASSGRDALEKCNAERPDLVLLDIHLPDFSGFEVCRRIRASPATASIMVIQISASAVELRDALAGLEGGADDFLMEPIEPELLTAKVRSLLRLRNVEERLRRSNDDLARFALVASHDLQEPLRSVVAFTELLNQRYRSKLDAQAGEYLDSIIGGGRRMSALIRDLLDYSRISGSSAEEQMVDLSKVVAQTQAWLKAPLEAANGSITAEALPRVIGTEVRITQLIRNLIENAIKYRRTDVPLEIHVGATQSGCEWVFSVSDNGQGFDPAQKEEIFGVFHRLDSGVEGTGMGLAICRAVVETAGGKIWAESRPGEGTTFYFTWPASANAAAGIA
jgi:signal transduction histidine kinase